MSVYRIVAVVIVPHLLNIAQLNEFGAIDDRSFGVNYPVEAGEHFYRLPARLPIRLDRG